MGRWLTGPDSTVLVAEEGPEGEAEVIGLALLLPRPPAPFAGAVPRKVVVIDNLVVRADRRDRGIGELLVAASMEWRAGRAPATSNSASMPSIVTRCASTSVLASACP